MSKSPPLVASLLLLSLTGCGPSNSGSATNQPGAPSAAEDESAADAAVKKLNGKTVRDVAGKGVIVTEVDFTRVPVTDADLSVLAGTEHLHKLNLAGTKVTDAGLKALSDLGELQELQLGGTAVTDAGMKDLAG